MDSRRSSCAATRRPSPSDSAPALDGACWKSRPATREQLASVEGLTPSFVDALLILLGGSPNRDATEHLFLCPECGSFVGTGATACPFCGVQFEGSTGAGLAAELDDFLREDVPT